MPGTENKLYLASQVQEVPLEMLPQNMQSSSHLSESKNKFKKKIFFFLKYTLIWVVTFQKTMKLQETKI